MKKITTLLICTLMSVSLNAQWFLSGNVGFNVRDKNDKYEMSNGDNSKSNLTEFGFSIAPKIGYSLNEKLALGLGVRTNCQFGFGEERVGIDIKNTRIEWGIYPFVRYTVFTHQKFSLLLEGNTGFGMGHSLVKVNDVKIGTGLNTIQIDVLNIIPILNFRLNDHFQIETSLNFLRLGYNIHKSNGTSLSTIDGQGRIVKQIINHSTQHTLDFGFSSGIFQFGELNLGLVYKF